MIVLEQIVGPKENDHKSKEFLQGKSFIFAEGCVARPNQAGKHTASNPPGFYS